MRFTSVKLRRFERGLLQVEVARRAEMPCGRLAEIENGGVEPEPDELRRIATALETSPQHLLDWTTPSAPTGADAFHARYQRIRREARAPAVSR